VPPPAPVETYTPTYTQTYVPPAVGETPAAPAPPTSASPSPSAPPTTRSRPRTNVTRSDNPYYVPPYTGAPKP